jgi:hypothetical protein
MSGWNTFNLIVGILLGILGIWNLARQRNVFLSLTGVLWFLIMLFQLFIPKVSNLHLLSGIPTIGTLLLYALVPIFIILSFFTGGRR